jgi:lipid-binding SYLF domain-containing protein
MRTSIPALVVMLLVTAGCAGPKGASAQAQRDYTLDMRDRTLERLYEKYPAARPSVERGPGYAVFENRKFGLMIFASGSGYGVVTENASNRNTYMKVYQFSPGFGLTGNVYKMVIVFNDDAALRRFLGAPLEVGIRAEAGAKVGATGGTLGGAVPLARGVQVYQFTDTGIVLRADVPIVKYMRNDRLNRDRPAEPTRATVSSAAR